MRLAQLAIYQKTTKIEGGGTELPTVAFSLYVVRAVVERTARADMYDQDHLIICSLECRPAGVHLCQHLARHL